MAANRYDLLMRTLEDPDAKPLPLPQADRRPEPWESSMQATCECLSWRGSLDNLERRHAEDDLGESLYAECPVYARSVLVTAHALMDKGIITPDELEAKMQEVRARLEDG